MTDKCAACGEWLEPVVFGDGTRPPVCSCGHVDEGGDDFPSREWAPPDPGLWPSANQPEHTERASA